MLLIDHFLAAAVRQFADLSGVEQRALAPRPRNFPSSLMVRSSLCAKAPDV